MPTLTAQTLAIICGALLSLAFSYVPGLKDWFEKITDSNKKRGIMGILIILTGLAIFGLGCAGVLAKYLVTPVCTLTGFWDLLGIIVLTLMANQTMYSITPTKSVG
jgi:hypothetical protein